MTTRQHPLEHRVPPPLVGVAAVLVQRRLPRREPSTGRRVLAGSVAAASLTLVAAAGQLFRRSGTTVDPLKPERATSLVTDGAFTLTRNPMYVAMGGVLLAHAIGRGHPAQLLPVAGFAVFIDRFQIQAEERALEQVFGAEYDAYRQRVRRWL